mmetsp:Transcript_14494/g.33498  ORF Transcript_14494/g.33498 Transcript_14494/m.33498 type:complete len:204 (+) Transcript_14494:596-1207(+)
MYSAWFSILVRKSLTTDASPVACPCTALAADRAMASSSCRSACCCCSLSFSACTSARRALSSSSSAACASPSWPEVLCRVASSSFDALSSACRLRNLASVSSFFVLMPSRNRMNFSLNASWFLWRSRSSSLRRLRSCACLSASACSSSTLCLSLSFSFSSAAFATGAADGSRLFMDPLWLLAVDLSPPISCMMLLAESGCCGV